MKALMGKPEGVWRDITLEDGEKTRQRYWKLSFYIPMHELYDVGRYDMQEWELFPPGQEPVTEKGKGPNMTISELLGSTKEAIDRMISVCMGLGDQIDQVYAVTIKRSERGEISVTSDTCEITKASKYGE